MMRKKALVLCDVFYPENFIINDLVEQWEYDQYEFEVLTRAPSYPFGKVYKDYKNKIYQNTYYGTIKVHRVAVLEGYDKSKLIKILNYGLFVFLTFWFALLKGRRYDKIFIYQAGPLSLATAGIIIKKIYQAKVTLWIQDWWPEAVFTYGFKKTKFLSYCLDSYCKWIYKNSDQIFVSCQGMLAKMKKFVPEKSCYFIPNWSLTKYDPKHKITLPGSYNFTFAGNIGTVQNLDNLVLGFKEFVKGNNDVYLNIIGDGSYLKELKTFVIENNISNVSFTGRIPLTEMSDYFEATDVLIISLKESPLLEIMVPSKLQAYLSTCKPIYAVMNGEVKDIVERNRIGFSASPSNVKKIAAGFDLFLNLKKEDLDGISLNSRKLLDEVYDREKIISTINKLFW